ncbi:MAG: cell division protein ZapA [Bacteroidales bacterium]|nr:cell division protein ZapA [Bacteroidales bacterium]
MAENEVIVKRMTVKICERTYQLKSVNTSQEGLIRNAEKDVNDSVANVAKRIKGDSQDHLALTALNIRMQHLKDSQKSKNDTQLVSTIKNVIELLDDVLAEE